MRVKLMIISMLLLVAAVMSGQTKKVAILETVDKKGDLDYSVKLMLRSNLAKAITNTSGYEAYDRTDLDAIMGEQDFQRTGMVSDDQIKRLGEMTGADYILVAEAVVAGESNMFITAKILNVESARTEKTDNALMGISPVDIQRGCEELAGNLFGIKLSSNNITNDKNQSEQPATRETSRANNGNAFSRLIRKEPDQAVPAVIQAGGIGSLIRFEDGSAGIIFYLNPVGGGGLAVSLDEAVLKWDSSKKLTDIIGLLNEDDKCSLMCSPGTGALNTDRILAQLSVNAPAASWCRGHGKDWYLPSAGEFLQLVTANNNRGRKGPISKAIVDAGGEPFMSNYYWVSNEEGKKEAYNFPITGRSADTEKKSSAEAVRAIRMF